MSPGCITSFMRRSPDRRSGTEDSNVPGFVGAAVWGPVERGQRFEASFARAQESLRHAVWQKTFFANDPAETCRYAIVEKDYSRQVQVHASATFDAIIYGVPTGPFTEDAAERLRTLAQAGDMAGLIEATKGRASLLIHDRARRQLTLFSDPYGVYHLFVHQTPTGWQFASELKALHPFLETHRFDVEAIESYLEIGLFPRTSTWFSDIEAMPPGALYRCDLDSGTIDKRVSGFVDALVEKRYGAHSQTPYPLTYDEAVDRMRETFAAAIADLDAQAPATQDLLLSGGRDSRALLGELAPRGHLSATTTYGQAGCSEREIAASASRASAISHRAVDVTEGGWLAPRLAASWYIDGAIDIRNTHIIHCMPQVRPAADAMWDGYFGDAIYGGKSPNYAPGRTFAEFHVERGWKFTSFGPQIVRNWYDPLLPLVDKDLWSFAMGLPRAWTDGSKIYDDMLLRSYPGLFAGIPTNNLGIPIGAPRLARQASSAFVKMAINAVRVLQLAGIDASSHFETMSYVKWLSRPARGILKDDLGIQKMFLPDILGQSLPKTRPHTPRQLLRNLRMLSAEIYLQQLCEAKLRPQRIGSA
jgi:hypothetical protein